MSQVSKGKALRPWRVREQVARELAEVIIASPHAVRAHSTRTGGFDVHAAREHARSLVALADEQAAFEDWTRGRAMGPENREPGAFRSAFEDCGYCFGDGLVDYGNGDVRYCPNHCYQGKRRYPALGGWPGNLAREWARQGGDSRAPMGRSLARLGQHILSALEGQPSECQGVGCNGGRVRLALAMFTGLSHANCEACQGTGHNLRGYLPKPEASPQLRRKLNDAPVPLALHDRMDWVDRLLVSAGDELGEARAVPMMTTLADGRILHREDTRVTPRGEHRHTGAWPSAAEAHRRAPKGSEQRSDALDSLVSERLWDCYSSPDFGLHWPRWRRGELKHAQQRREREQRAYELEMSEHALTPADVL